MRDLEELKEHKVENQAYVCNGFEATCWGCGLQLALDYFVPVFKCGWCGAVTVHWLPSSKRGFNYGVLRDRVFVVIVVAVMLFFIGGGIWAIFPIIFPGFSFGFFLHSFVVTVLSVNTLINYCLAVFVPAGHPPSIEWGRVGLVDKGSLDGHRYCHICRGPKPPQAHHCQTCNNCVMEMDHHCPFIGNCVGAANRRHFVLFLFFVVLSTLYTLLMSSYAGYIMWPHLLEVHRRQSHSAVLRLQTSLSFVIAPIKLFMSGQVFLSARALTLAYLFVASLSVAIGVGLLLHHQLLSIYSGQTFLDSLQISQGILRDNTIKAGWVNFRKVFGNDNLLFWIVPRVAQSHETLGKKCHSK